MPAEDWSRLEVEAIVDDYFKMLLLELSGRPFSRADHNRGMQKVLNGRSKGSIEFKHQNISAVLRDIGHPWIDGYKPRGNYQQLLYEVVADRIDQAGELRAVIVSKIAEPADVRAVENVLARVVEPPEKVERTFSELQRAASKRPLRAIDYVAREAANTSLGRAGEEFVLRFERERLNRLQRPQLADRIEHVSVTEGDGAGFDIRSFEEDGTDRLVEVKTTAYAKAMPFFVTRNEVTVSEKKRDQYHLYRVFKFREDPRLYTVRGSLEQQFRLEASQYLARAG